MLATLAWGGYQLLFSAEEQPSGKVKKMDTSELSRFAGDIAKGMHKLKGGKNADQVLQSALEQWEKDPFLVNQIAVISQPDATGASKSVDTTGLQYTGFLQMGAQRIAVISGIEYAQGDQLVPGGLQVLKIEPTHVEVIDGNSQARELLQMINDPFDASSQRVADQNTKRQ